MREINCPEDRICQIAPMKKIMQKGGGGLASAQNDYMIPYSQAVAMVKKDRVGRKTSQAGKGRRRKPKTISKTPARKKKTSKKSAPKKKIVKKRKTVGKVRKPKSVRKRKCCIEI